MSASHEPHPRGPLFRRDGSRLRVLVVDDDREVAEIVSIMLSWEGAQVLVANDAQTALRLARAHPPDMAIFDPGLPGSDGLALLLTLREMLPGLPVLMVMSAAGANDRPARFAAGYDCLNKPFSVEELSLRLRIMLRRESFGLEVDGADIVVGDLVLNEEGREVLRGGRPINLAYTEFELLRYLMRNPHRVLTKQQILGRVWPYRYGGRSNVVELYVSYLRKKIDRGVAPMIHTVRLSGYLLKPALDRS